MENKMTVAVMEGVGKIGFTQRDIPTPAPGRGVGETGVCGYLWQRFTLYRELIEDNIEYGILTDRYGRERMDEFYRANA